MTHIAYSGNISPAVWLSFKGNKVPGAHASADDDYVYEIENECLFEWDIVFNTGSHVHHLTRRASRRNRYFSASLNTYRNPPVNASVLNEILDAQDSGTLSVTVTMKIWYHSFFRHILHEMRQTVTNENNLANPSDQAAVLGAFRRRSGGRYRYAREEQQLRDIPAMLSGFDIVPSGGSGPPGVKLYIYLKVKENLATADANNVTEYLVASDYSKVNKYGRYRANAWDASPPPARVPTIEVCLETWERNLWQYFLNYADLTRGRHLMNHIVGQGRTRHTRGGGQLEVVREVRNGIDQLLITANHWGQRREDRTTEAYQYQMSNIFGSIHQSRWRASPVRVIRKLDDMHTYNLNDHAAFILQVGCGHCGEHAAVSFAILCALHGGGMSALLGSIVKSGNANIDHAFVVGGLRPREIIETTIRSSRNSSGSVGDAIDVWNLRDALTDAGAGTDGYVCDPYLDPSQIAQTARALLASLNSARRRSRHKDTDFLWYGDVFPATPALSRTAVASVRNV
ncbi:hypothetical protein [Desulfosarcina ovata]|uniref:Uncharacterized protein n=1 Tax=Desulfosarcina ovata subsp. ovata TaxID=2752305 RepID=A0A5K8A8T9_9BACT|nr:hypothetical protein [Desulfosarcina ovata]BBO88754.1 hypothetical protein DSCOOX_19340 [Desulfosarcina ovata subsp. ovata]